MLEAEVSELVKVLENPLISSAAAPSEPENNLNSEDFSATVEVNVRDAVKALNREFFFETLEA